MILSFPTIGNVIFNTILSFPTVGNVIFNVIFAFRRRRNRADRTHGDRSRGS
jgi:hypothetical protein